MELLLKVGNLVLTPLLNSMGQQIAYLCKAGDNMRDLESATQNLLAKKDDLMEKVETAERTGQKRTRQFQEWLGEVDDTKKEADEVVEKYKQKRMRFFTSNYSLGKAAAKTFLDVKRLSIDERTQEVAITPAPPAVQEMPVFTTSLTSIPYVDPNLGIVLGYLREDDKAGMIGVWGMGGVGKTRFLKQINNSFVGDSSFDHVIWITVSRSCPIAKVQKQIVENLKIQKAEDDNSQSKIIFNFLKNRSFLLLLDDLWERIDLQEVGIPLPLGLVGGCKRKAVLTTRSLDVCGQMEVMKSIKLECLSYDDAFNLFLEKVTEETINSHPGIRSLAGNIVKELGGLPLALITIGRAMYQKKELKEWEHAIKQVKRSQLHELEHSHVKNSDSEGLFHILKISYDYLNSDTLKECFLSCSMWPEDESIIKDELINCWMGLGLIKDFDDMSEAYGSGYSLIGNLMAACLLEKDVVDGLVILHDLLRDMALWIVHDNGKSKNKWVVVEDEVPRDKKIWHVTERISIKNTEMEKLPPVADNPSKLTTLMLQSNIFLQELGDLRAFIALTYLDLSSCGFDNFPIEVCVLVQLQYLNLAYNCNINSLPEELGFLVNLKFLILTGNDVHIIPQDVIAKLKYLQVLDLFKTSNPDGEILTFLPSPLLEELESLNDLKGLGICVQGTSQLRRLIELDNMPIWRLAISRLNDFSLSASFLTDEKIQKNLSSLRIMDSKLNQLVIESDHQHPTCHLPKLEHLQFDNMHCFKEIIWEGVVPKKLFQGLRYFKLDSCDMLKDISWVLHLPHLRKLDIYNCSSMNQLIASEADDDSTPTFPCLETIILKTLPELVSICHSTFAFPALSYVDVWNCPNLKKLPFQTENIPSKLHFICGKKEWLDGLEWESGVKACLENFFSENDGTDDDIYMGSSDGYDDEEIDDGGDDEEPDDGDGHEESRRLLPSLHLHL